MALEWFQSSAGRLCRNCGMELGIFIDALQGLSNGGWLAAAVVSCFNNWRKEKYCLQPEPGYSGLGASRLSTSMLYVPPATKSGVSSNPSNSGQPMFCAGPVTNLS